MELTAHFFKAPAGSFFLFGPQYTGKSTFIQQSFPDATNIELLYPEEARSLSARPERLKEDVMDREKNGKKNKKWGCKCSVIM